MAKVSLNKLTPIKKVDPITITIGEETIEVIQYLSVGEKLNLLENVLNSVIDDTGYFNPIKMEIYFLLHLIKSYTNISLTDKMMSEPIKTYDLLEMNKVFDSVIAAIPADEYETLYAAAEKTATHVVKYLDSFVGMLKTVSADQEAMKNSIDSIMNSLNNPEDLGLLKDVIEKLG